MTAPRRAHTLRTGMRAASGTLVPSAETESHVGDVHEACTACGAAAVPVDARFCPFCGERRIAAPILFVENLPAPAPPPVLPIAQLSTISDIVVLPTHHWGRWGLLQHFF